MALPIIEGTGHGRSVCLFGHDLTRWRALLVDALGHLQVDIISSALASGAATEATLATLATEAKLELVRLLLASIDGKDFATQTTLAALLTELQAKADLTETQPISVASLPLPSGAATEASLEAVETAVEKIDDFAHVDNTIFGFYTDYQEMAAETTTDGATLVESSGVSSGEVWVVTALLGYHNDPTAREVRLQINGIPIVKDLAVAQNQGVDRQGFWPLTVGEKSSVRCMGLAAGKTCYLRAAGYKMKV